MLSASPQAPRLVEPNGQRPPQEVPRSPQVSRHLPVQRPDKVSHPGDLSITLPSIAGTGRARDPGRNAIRATGNLTDALGCRRFLFWI